MQRIKQLLLQAIDLLKGLYKRNPAAFTAAAAAVFVLGLAAVYASVELTSTVSFCTSCHEMKTAHETWLESKHSKPASGKRAATCRDCHLPPWTKPAELLWSKAYHGAKDVTKHFTDAEEMKHPGYYFNMKMHAGSTIDNASCLKCHGDVYKKKYEGYENIHGQLKNNPDMKCFKCHETTAHSRYLPKEMQ